MSEINKTEAVVLSKMNYGDTSCIVSLFTKEYGKLSAIIKGARSPKSKLGLIIDPLNSIEIILYQKDNRDLQFISTASLVEHFSKIKEDIEKLKNAYAILELVKNLTVDHEVNERLYKGLFRILSLINSSDEAAGILFGRFFLFFLKELGYELRFDACSVCGKTNLFNSELSYNFEFGILCSECRQDHIESFSVNMELFNYLNCLRLNKTPENISKYTIDKAIVLMEKFLKHHVADFKGIQSFHLFK